MRYAFQHAQQKCARLIETLRQMYYTTKKKKKKKKRKKKEKKRIIFVYFYDKRTLSLNSKKYPTFISLFHLQLSFYNFVMVTLISL